ncbi:MAG: hypothetical protein MHM6MM_006012, partial [Cercozoa sp. M6MM]
LAWSDIENDQNWANNYPWPEVQRAARGVPPAERRRRNNARGANEDNPNHPGDEENDAAREEPVPVAPRQNQPDEVNFSDMSACVLTLLSGLAQEDWSDYVRWREEPVVARVPLVERRNVRRINNTTNWENRRANDENGDLPGAAIERVPAPPPEHRPIEREDAENIYPLRAALRAVRVPLAVRDGNWQNRRVEDENVAPAMVVRAVVGPPGQQPHEDAENDQNRANNTRQAAARGVLVPPAGRANNRANRRAPRRLNLRPAIHREYGFGRPRLPNRRPQQQPPIAGNAAADARPAWLNPNRFFVQGMLTRR